MTKILSLALAELLAQTSRGLLWLAGASMTSAARLRDYGRAL